MRVVACVDGEEEEMVELNWEIIVMASEFDFFQISNSSTVAVVYSNAASQERVNNFSSLLIMSFLLRLSIIHHSFIQSIKKRQHDFLLDLTLVCGNRSNERRQDDGRPTSHDGYNYSVLFFFEILVRFRCVDTSFSKPPARQLRNSSFSMIQ